MTLREIMEAEETDMELDIAADMEREFPTRKDMSMASPNYDKYAGVAVEPRQSPFDNLVNAVDELRGCDHQFGILADRISGPQPQEVAGQAAPGGGGGLIDVVERAIMSIRAITSNLNEHHSRIDRRL